MDRQWEGDVARSRAYRIATKSNCRMKKVGPAIARAYLVFRPGSVFNQRDMVLVFSVSTLSGMLLSIFDWDKIQNRHIIRGQDPD